MIESRSMIGTRSIVEPRSNEELARTTLQTLRDNKIDTLCICPGARNSPWLSLLDEFNFQIYSFFDERSAGFFALAQARVSDRPVAVVTTSGTAVGELLPAMMESFYSGSKLVVLSADRPKRFRGTGAPQSCEQHKIFGSYTSVSLDIDRDAILDSSLNPIPLCLNLSGPTHWNVCFEEPLPSSELNRAIGHDFKKPDAINFADLEAILQMARAPLIIVAELSRNEAQLLAPILARWGLPVITETLSQLREEPSLEHLRIRPHKNLWEECKAASYSLDLVIRFGGVPTLRFWRDLEVHPKASQIAVVSVGDSNFSGLPRAKHLQMNLKDWLESTRIRFSNVDFKKWKSSQQNLVQQLSENLAKSLHSEPSWFFHLSNKIQNNSHVYLGNSLPLREWDLAATTENKNFTYHANRGLNGIDGQLSSFFGGLSLLNKNWCILGDLTTLYDSTAPWILNQIDPKISWKLVIVNNKGGQIFKRMFQSKIYLNEHSFSFKNWALQWGLSYQKLTLPTDEIHAQVIELNPDIHQTDNFWKNWEPS